MVDNQMELARTHSGPVVTELNWNTADHLSELKNVIKEEQLWKKSTFKNKYSGKSTQVKTNDKEKTILQTVS